MQCPRCGLHNLESALCCDCGYDLATGNQKESYPPPPAHQPERVSRTGAAGFFNGSAIWLGYVLVRVIEIATTSTDLKVLVSAFRFLIAFGAVVYWFVCVYKLHRLLRKATGGIYPISPGAAAGYNLIPIYGLYWIFKWPAEVGRFLKARRIPVRVSMPVVSAAMLIGLFLIGSEERGGLWGIQLFILYAAGYYLEQKVILAAGEEKRG